VLNGIDLSCYSNRTEWVSVRKCPYDHWLTNKAFFSAITVINITQSFTYKMVAKVDWHGYGTKLCHCHPMYINSSVFAVVSCMPNKHAGHTVMIPAEIAQTPSMLCMWCRLKWQYNSVKYSVSTSYIRRCQRTTVINVSLQWHSFWYMICNHAGSLTRSHCNFGYQFMTMTDKHEVACLHNHNCSSVL